MEKFRIPEQCIDCPKLVDYQESLEAANALKAGGEEFSQKVLMNPEVSASVGMPHADGSMTVSPLDQDERDAFINYLKRETAEQLNQIDEQIEQAQSDVDDLTAQCEGSLAMRANRGGKQYTVRICTSLRGTPVGQASMERVEVTINYVD